MRHVYGFDPGYAGPLSHFVILEDGTIYQLRPLPVDHLVVDIPGAIIEGEVIDHGEGVSRELARVVRR